MFGKLLKFELSLQARQIGFWVTIFIMLCLGVLFMSVDWAGLSVEGGGRIKNNGANTLAAQISSLSIASIFFACVFVVSGIMRDDIHKSTEIIHATSVKTSDLIIPRMIGVWIATFLCLLAVVIGLFAGQFAPWVDKETMGPIRVSYYLYPTIIFLLINSLFMSGFFSLIAGLTRNRMMVYVSAIGLLVLYIGAGFLTQDAPKWLSSIMSPFGDSAMAVETQYWPADEQNTRLLPLNSHIGINRLFWGGAGVAMFWAVYKMFVRGLVGRKVKNLGADFADRGERRALKAVAPQFGGLSWLSAFWTRAKMEYLTTVRSIPFYMLCGIAMVLVGVVFVLTTFLTPDPTLPTSNKMAKLSVAGFSLPILLVIIFFSGEISWRDRTAKINEVLDATPVRNWQLMLAKWAGLILTILTMVTFALVVGMILQMAQGNFAISLPTYAKAGYVSFAGRFVLYACLALFVQNFMPNRIVGMFATAAVLIFLEFFVTNLPFFHPLMEFGRLPAGNLSEMNGYQSLINYKWFGLYGLMTTGVLAVLSVWLWRRGLQIGLFSRLRGMKARMSPVTLGLAGLFLVGSIGTGLHIKKAYDKVDYRNQKANELRTVQYEKLFKDIAERTLPKIQSVNVDVDFSPSRRDGFVQGQYILENVTDAPLTELFVRIPISHPEDVKRLDVEGAERDLSEKGKEYADYRYWRYEFNQPVAVGDQVRLDFEVYFHPPRLVDGSPIRRNGTFINSWDLLPSLDVLKAWLQNPDKRRKYDLPELPKRPVQTDEAARQINFFSGSGDYMDFKARVCTDPGQIPIAPGQKISEENIQKNGYDRHCRTYEAVRPIVNFYSFLSGDYTVSEDVWENPNGDDVPLAIYYHEPHGFNIELMHEATKQALSTFSELFSPYQYNQVRIMEFPHGNFAQSFAGTIPFSENVGFVRDPGNPDDPTSIDLASYITMHELGHQWFGHQIVPADTQGFNVLSEGLTENAAMTAYERAFGWKKARRVLEKRSIELYLASRVFDRKSEPSLANAEGQGYLDYQKANWVFWGLKQNMGEEAMQGAIRNFVEEFGSKGPPYPTTHQLIDHLRAAAGPDYQQLITDYWERITFWDLGLDNVAVTEKGGQFEVSFTAKVDKKIATEETGKETSVTEIDDEELNEWVEIGFYDFNPKETLGGDWIKLERVRVTDLETSMSVSMDKKPTYILIDPRRLLIERNVEDNVKKIDAAREG